MRSLGQKHGVWIFGVAIASSLLLAYWVFADRHDLAHGKQLYAECIGCHAPQRIVVGPPHCGLFGRRAGSVAEYGYSDAMRNSGIVWDTRHLDGFLRAPLDYVRGTNMGYAGLADPTDRADLIAYLRQVTKDATFCAEAVG